MTRLRFVMFCVFCFAACASTQPVTLRHPSTGLVVQCGPYKAGFFDVGVGAPIYQRERDCIADYQRQGYERAPR